LNKSNIALNNENQLPNKTFYALVYFLSYITLGMSTAVLGPMLSQIGDSVGVSLGVVSLLLAIKAAGYFIGSVGGGRIFDRFAGHKVQVIAISLMTFCMFLIPLTNSFITIIFIMISLGIMEGTLDVGGNTLLLWKFKSNVAPFMNGLHFFFGLGAFLAPIIVANVLHFDTSLRWTFWLLGLIFIPSIIGFALLPSPIQPKKEEIKEKLTVKRTVIILIIILFFTYVGTELSFGSWIYTYSLRSNLANEITSAYLTSAFWGALTIGRLIGVILSKAIKPEKFLIIDFSGSIVSLLIIIIWSNSIVGLWLGTILFGLFMASVFPMLLIFAENHYQISGAMTGWFFVGASSGGIVFPLIISQVICCFN